MALRYRIYLTPRTLLCLLVLPVALITVSAAVLVMALLRVPRSRIDRIYTGFAAFARWVANTPLHVSGLENFRPGQAYIVVPNHESDWDPVMMVAALSMLPVRFIVKRQITQIPIFGWALLRSGNVRVVRTHTQGDVERIREKMASRPLDVSILFYAEGSRSRDGALHPFRKGAFATAIAYGMPILPVGHGGCYGIWKPLTLGIHSGPVTVEIGRPIPVEGLTYDDREKLRDQTFEVVRDLRTQARKRLRDMGGDPGGID
jgi:1-acyl-sn-glycerol-3-phosphate acyltransferase